MATETVNQDLALISQTVYSSAVYNLAGHLLIETAQDLPGAVFTGYISGNNLNVVSVTSGALSTQQVLVATGLQPNTTIIGGSGVAWEVNPSQTYASLATPVSISSKFTYFTNLRAQWQVNQFVPGVIASTSDESTSASYKNPAVMDNLLFSDLSYVKTPFGRNYLSIAARYGSPFGVS